MLQISNMIFMYITIESSGNNHARFQINNCLGYSDLSYKDHHKLDRQYKFRHVINGILFDKYHPL